MPLGVKLLNSLINFAKNSTKHNNSNAEPGITSDSDKPHLRLE